MKKQLQIAAQKLCSYTPPKPVQAVIDHVKKYPINYAGAFWVSSVAFLSLAPKLSGTVHEGVGGDIMMLGEASALLLGKFRYTYNFACLCFVTGSMIQRVPEFAAHPLATAAGLGVIVIANTPSLVEYPVMKKARTKLLEFQKASGGLVKRALSKTKWGGLWAFANPRNATLDMNAAYIVVSVIPTVWNAIADKKELHTLKYLLPFYGLMMIGNRIATLSSRQRFSPEPLSRRHLARQHYFKRAFGVWPAPV